jgi:SAM-dependent methyltransferase
VSEEKSAVRHRDDCRLCRSFLLKRVVELAPVPVLTANIAGQSCPPHMEMAPLILCQCKCCGHLQLSAWIDPELQYRNFNYRTASSSGLIAHFDGLADQVWQRVIDGGRNLFVVDIGSNDGTLLRTFKKYGAVVLGIEPGVKIAEEAEAAGIPTYPLFFNREVAKSIIKLEGRQADVILCCNTMANLNDLDDFIDGIYTLLKSGGMFVFETQYGADVIAKTLIDTIYHEHQSYFLIESLERFFWANKLELVSMESIPTKGGSIRGYVRHQGSGVSDSSVRDLIKKERTYNLGTQETYDKFTYSIEQMRENVVQALPGGLHTAAGFGVSVGSSTLIAQLELEHALEYLVDDNPLIGALPGEYHDLPVYSSAYLYEDKPDRVVILAWRYADQIIAKHRSFLDEGGEFIVPWPEFKIVGKSSDIG